MGWGHAKQELFEIINDHVVEPRERYFELRVDTAQLTSILDDGAKRALDIAMPVLNRIREAMGFRKFPYSLNL